MTGRARVAACGGIATLAASTALGAVFAGFGWLPAVTGGIIVVVAISELVRWSPLPSAFGPVLAAGAVTCYLTFAYAGDAAYGRFIPTGTSMRLLGDLARTGFHDIRTLGTPVPTNRGLVLIATTGIAAVALVVDLFAATMRRAALAGLPLLATFALCTSVARHGAGWVPFTIGAAGYLWLLLADSRDRLTRWGRPLGSEGAPRARFSWSDQDIAPSPLSVMGRRIGLSAIAAGVVLPIAIPGLHGGVPHHGNGFGFGHGGSNKVVTINPIVTIGAELKSSSVEEILTVQTTDGDPGYLRLTSLDQFDGQTFAPSTLTASSRQSVKQGIHAAVLHGSSESTTITVHGLEVHWLPVPTQVTAVKVDGDWRYDEASNTIFSARNDTHGLQYQVQSVRPDLSAAELESATTTVDPAMQNYLRLPVDVLRSPVVALTQRVIGSAKTPFDKAVAIQNFLKSPPFVYSTEVPSSASTDALTQFLTVTHAGFCQQYASAMAIMARIANIPSRVAVGFTRGSQQSDGTWSITTKDAHAWPELWLGNYGWVPFEPTPRTDGQAQPPAYSVKTQAPPPGSGPKQSHHHHKTKGGVSSGTGKSKLDHLDANADAQGGGVTASPPGHSAADTARRWLGWTLLALLVVGLVGPGLARRATRTRRWRLATTARARADAAWSELRAGALDARAGWIDGLTPAATARLLRAENGLGPAEDAALMRVVRSVERAWYAPVGLASATDDLEADVASISDALMAAVPPRQQLGLRLWPRSTLRAAREISGTKLTDVLDGVDNALAALRNRLRIRPA